VKSVSNFSSTNFLAGSKVEIVNDERFYDEVAKELQAKAMIPGLWTKAFADAGGDVDRARALYIKYRVAQLATDANEKIEKEKRAARTVLKQLRAKSIRRSTYSIFVIVFILMTFICGAAGVGVLYSDHSMDGIVGGIFSIAIAFVFVVAAYACNREASK